MFGQKFSKLYKRFISGRFPKNRTFDQKVFELVKKYLREKI
jgi:hypothetical protein